jgi:DNA-binding CsgD family transcriptional regulator
MMRPPPGTRASFPVPPGAAGVPLVGRAGVLAMLLELVDRARSGEPGPRLAVLRGDPGVGKSALLAAVAAAATARGDAVLAGRADDLERRVPYALLADAFGAEPGATGGQADAAGGALDQHEVPADPSPNLVGLVPGLLAERLARLLAARGRGGGCLLALDDLHAADDDSLAVVATLLRRLPPWCLVLAAVRARPPDLPVALAALLERLADEGAATVHELGPLEEGEAARLAERWLGARPDAALAAGLWAWCRGNPFYLRQAIRSLEEAGSLQRSGGGVVLAAGAGPPLAPASLVTLRLARLGKAAERTARVLTVFPAVGVHDLPEVAALAGLRAADAERAFDLLVAAGFLDRSPDGRFGFSHPIVRDTLHDLLGPAERRRLHGTIAATLLATRDAGAPVPVMELARHLAESAVSSDARAAAVLAEAGDAALPQAPYAAAEWLRRAVALLPRDAPDRGELLLRLARALYVASGAGEELVRVGQAAVDLLPGGPARDWIGAVTVAGLSLQHRREEALAVADRALAGQDAPMPSVMAEKARMLLYLGRLEEAAALAAQVIELGTDTRMPMIAIGTLVDVASYAGRVADSERLFHAAMAALDPEPTVDRLGVLCRWALRLAIYGELGRATAMIREADELHARFGGAVAPCASNLRAARVVCDWMSGRWDQVLEQAARPPNTRFVIEEVVQLLAADVHLERGDLQAATAIVEGLAKAPAFPPLWMWAAAGVAEAGGNADAARQLLAAVVDRAASVGLWGQLPPLLFRLVELEAAAGATAAAHERLVTLEWLAERDGTPLARVLALRARGTVAREPAAAREALVLALEQGMAVHAALARLQLGALGESPAEYLRAAQVAFRAMGAERWRRRAAAELRARGIPVPRLARRDPAALTDTEVRLARYVADGLTNREIAAAMSLSAGTVATYLTRVFAKTGTANRRQLGQAVRRGVLADRRR